MKVKELRKNAKNPRKISAKKKQMLARSMSEFGDLSGIVFNTRTKTLVSGHQRASVIPADTAIQIEKKYEPPTENGTVSEGFIEFSGEKIKYRAVDWDDDRAMAALLSANRNGGEWDNDMLRVALTDLKIDHELAGFEIIEMKELGIALIEPEPEQTDEQYVSETPETTEQIDVERISNSANAVEKTEEKAQNVIGRRFIIIIDCTSQEHKDAVKEKIQDVVVEAGGKFF